MVNFTQTSDGLYDKHEYKLVYSDGKVQIFENYYDLMYTWTNTNKELTSHVEVLDKKVKKQKSMGF